MNAPTKKGQPRDELTKDHLKGIIPKFTPDSITAITDSREQNPFDLSPMKSVVGTLNVGDYSVQGLESVISIERKSLMDFVACCGRERARFQRELDRLRGWPVSAVLIESTWTEIESGSWVRPRMKMTPNHVLGSLTSWISQGHTIIVAPRPMAERICKSILCHATRHRVKEVQNLVAGIGGAK